MTNGNECNRIATREGCEAAARELGLSDMTAQDTSDTRRAPNCYYKPENGDDQKLWFNTAFTSTASCSNERKCLCKSGNTVSTTGEHQHSSVSYVIIS